MYFNVLEEELLKYSQKKGSYFLVEYERHDLRLIPGCIEVYGRISTEALCGSSFPLMTSGWYTVQLSLRVHWLYPPKSWKQYVLVQGQLDSLTVSLSINVLCFWKHTMRLHTMSGLSQKLINFVPVLIFATIFVLWMDEYNFILSSLYSLKIVTRMDWVSFSLLVTVFVMSSHRPLMLDMFSFSLHILIPITKIIMREENVIKLIHSHNRL